ncbi:hypothetical protein ACFOWM_13240 [Ferruginibacter yonginensis]|uniref:Outer membrane protein beta-barrel domain-containing protein n=1 Tax=Ferruginibacter yonginensis TaxID=1310416 RepID=A0ABV8QUC9_9BACT
MKKTIYMLVFATIAFSNFSKAQTNKNSEFNLIASGGIGFANIINEKEPNYNLNCNSGEILINYYSRKKNIGIATGFGLTTFTGTGFNQIGNFYQERSVIKIPLLVTCNYGINEKFKLYSSFGVYTQTIIKDKFQYINLIKNKLYDGWNFGTQIQIAPYYLLGKNISLGIIFNQQSDFSKFKSNSNQLINDKQRIKNLNSFGVSIAMLL